MINTRPRGDEYTDEELLDIAAAVIADPADSYTVAGSRHLIECLCYLIATQDDKLKQLENQVSGLVTPWG